MQMLSTEKDLGIDERKEGRKEGKEEGREGGRGWGGGREEEEYPVLFKVPHVPHFVIKSQPGQHGSNKMEQSFKRPRT